MGSKRGLFDISASGIKNVLDINKREAGSAVNMDIYDSVVGWGLTSYGIGKLIYGVLSADGVGIEINKSVAGSNPLMILGASYQGVEALRVDPGYDGRGILIKRLSDPLHAGLLLQYAGGSGIVVENTGDHESIDAAGLNWHITQQGGLSATSGHFSDNVTLDAELSVDHVSAASGSFSSQVAVGDEVTLKDWDADVSCLRMEKTGGASNVVYIVNSGTGKDLYSETGGWEIDNVGTIVAPSGRFTNGISVGGGTIHINGDRVKLPGNMLVRASGTTCAIFGRDVFSKGDGAIGVIGIGTSIMDDATLTGNYNTCIGHSIMPIADTAYQNYMIGNSIGLNATSAYSNIAIGYEAQSDLTTGYQNISLGYRSAKQNRTGYSHIAIGYNAMATCGIDSYRNIAIGQDALVSVAWDHNVAIGYQAGNGAPTIDTSVLIGANCDVPANDLYWGMIGIGTNATPSGDYTLVVGNNAETRADDSIAIGRNAYAGGLRSAAIGYQASTNVDDEIRIGDDNATVVMASGSFLNGARIETGAHIRFPDNTIMKSSGEYNFAIGTNNFNRLAAGADHNFVFGDGAGSGLTSGDHNIIFGKNNGLSLGGGSHNILLGRENLDSATPGSVAGNYNTVFGYRSLRDCTTANYNFCAGRSNLFNFVTAEHNIAIGDYAMYEGQGVYTATNNIALGQRAHQNCRGSDYNIAIGYYALSQQWNGDNNIAVGRRALGNWGQGGGSNIGIGYGAGDGPTNGSNNIYIGNSATSPAYVGIGNVLTIGNNAVGSGNFNVVIGYAAETRAENAMAIGRNAFSYGLRSLALGYGAHIDRDEDDIIRIGDDNATMITASGRFLNGMQVGEGSVHISPDSITAPAWNINANGEASFAGINISTASGDSSLDITQNNDEIGLSITQAGEERGLYIDKTTVGDSHAMQIENAGSGSALDINNTGEGYGIDISNASATKEAINIVAGEGGGIKINSGSDGTSLEFIHTGGGYGIYMQKSGGTDHCFYMSNTTVGNCININNQGNSHVLDLVKTGAGAGDMIYLQNAGTGWDLRTTDEKCTIDKLGTITAQSGYFVNGVQIGTGTVHISSDSITIADNPVVPARAVASGWTGDMPGVASGTTAVFGDEYYHFASGYLRYGHDNIWDRITNPLLRYSTIYEDNAWNGQSFDLPVAEQFEYYVFHEASGGSGGTGVSISPSGFQSFFPHGIVSQARATYSVSVEGDSATTHAVALFKDDVEIPGTRSYFRSATVLDVSANIIIELGSLELISLRFAASSNNKPVKVWSAQMTLQNLGFII